MVYQDLEDLEACAREGNPDISVFESSVFNGEYVTGDIDTGYLADLSQHRSDAAKADREAANV